MPQDCNVTMVLEPGKDIEVWQKIVTLVDQSNEVVQQSRDSYQSKAGKFLSMMTLGVAIQPPPPLE